MVTSLAQLDQNKQYSYAEYLTWKFEERVELLRGFIAKMAAPSRIHQEISGILHAKIRLQLWHSPCKIYAAPFDVRLPHFSKKLDKNVTTVVQPDLCIVCDPSKLDARGCAGAPDLIIEILSPGNSKKEMIDKFTIYEEAGVKEYWLVQPAEKTILRYVLNEKGEYIGLRPMTEEGMISTPIVPDFEMDIKDIFEI